MKHIIIPNVSNEICVNKRLWFVQQPPPLCSIHGAQLKLRVPVSCAEKAGQQDVNTIGCRFQSSLLGSSLFPSFAWTSQLNSTSQPGPQDNLHNVNHKLSQPLPAFSADTLIRFLMWKPSLLRVGTEVSATLRRKRTICSWKQFIPCNLTTLFLETDYTESATYIPKKKCKKKVIFILYNAKNEKQPIVGLLKKLYLISEYCPAVKINEPDQGRLAAQSAEQATLDLGVLSCVHRAESLL